MKKRLLALVLALTMVLSLLTGCTISTPTTKADPILSRLDEAAVADVVSYLSDGALKSDDAAITVNGEDVPAAFYFYWVAYMMTNMESQGLTADMLDDTSLGDPTISEYLRQSGVDYASYYTVLHQMAVEEGVKLDADDNNQVTSYVESTEPAMLLYYATSDASLKHFYESYLLSSKLTDALYGEDSGNAPTEEDLIDYAKDTYYTCRYLLFPTHNSAGEEIDSETQKKNCQKAYDELKKVDADKLEETFQTYQEKWNNEDGADGNTEPFTFTSGSVVEGFETTAVALGDNELGMTTEETSYGYFVILRLPLEMTDSIRDEAQTGYVNQAIDAAIQERTTDSELVVSEALENLDMTAFCTKLMELQVAIAEARAAVEAEEAAANAADSSADAADIDTADSSVAE